MVEIAGLAVVVHGAVVDCEIDTDERVVFVLQAEGLVLAVVGFEMVLEEMVTVAFVVPTEMGSPRNSCCLRSLSEHRLPLTLPGEEVTNLEVIASAATVLLSTSYGGLPGLRG